MSVDVSPVNYYVSDSPGLGVMVLAKYEWLRYGRQSLALHTSKPVGQIPSSPRTITPWSGTFRGERTRSETSSE